MLIQISRIYITSGIEVDVLLNTDYMIKVEGCDDMDKPCTRIVMDGLNDPMIIYTNESLSIIKGKLSKARNKKEIK